MRATADARSVAGSPEAYAAYQPTAVMQLAKARAMARRQLLDPEA
jgi:hypothetical protein